MREIWTDGPVDEGETLWRYFRADRFIDAITNRTLYFASAREFEDRFEGATAIVQPRPIDARFVLIEGADQAFEELRRLTKISCWNRGHCESEAICVGTKGCRRADNGLPIGRLVATVSSRA